MEMGSPKTARVRGLDKEGDGFGYPDGVGHSGKLVLVEAATGTCVIGLEGPPISGQGQGCSPAGARRHRGEVFYNDGSDGGQRGGDRGVIACGQGVDHL